MPSLSSVTDRSAPRGYDSSGFGGGDSILVVAPQPFYDDRGTPIAIRHLVVSLVGSGFSVDVLTYPLGSDLDIPEVRIMRIRNWFGLQSVPIGFSWRKLILDLFLIGRLWRMVRRGPYRAIHAVEEMAFPAVLFGGRYRVPVVYDMQSSLPEQLRAKRLFRTAAMQRLLRRAERWLIEHADAVVCSAGLARYVRGIAPHAPVAEWEFPPAPPQQAPAGSVPTRAELGLSGSARIVLYAGTFETYQGLKPLMEAMTEVVAAEPEAVLVLIGATEMRGPPQNEAAAGLARSGHLVVLPRQPQESIPHFLAMADILISPRLYGDNVPLKIFDYMRAGKPIVATDTTGHLAVLSNDIAVLVHRDPASMAAGILRLLANPDLARTLAARARKRAHDCHHDEVFSSFVSRVYERILSVDTVPIRDV